MTVRRSENLQHDDQLLRIKLLAAENKKLRTIVAKLEVKNISLGNENRALKRHIETRANEKFNEILGKIMQRAEQDSGQAQHAGHSRHS